jgi:hypothetical protein
MEIFQQVDSESFGSHAFMFINDEVPCSINDEVPCSKFQSIVFINFFTNKYIKASFRLTRFHDWLHWKVDCVDLPHLTDHLVAWLHWSFKYVD